MTTTMHRPPADAVRTPAAAAAGTAVPLRAGRRDGKRVAVGVLLVVATVVAFWQIDLRRHEDASFMAVTRPVAAGQVITDADLGVARVANSSDVALVPVGQRAQVVGRTASVPLTAGSLLTAGQLGEVAWPPVGQAVIAVPVKPGRAPLGLAAGTRVVVLVTSSTAVAGAKSDAPAAARRATAAVVSVVEGGDQAGGQLVTLLLDVASAEAVAAASGEVSLVQLGPER